MGGTFGFLSSFQPQPKHESGPPGLQTDVLGLVLACHPAQRQPLCEQEETQGDVRRREHQTEAWRVSHSAISYVMCNCGALAVKIYGCFLAPGSINMCLFCVLLHNIIANMIGKRRAGDRVVSVVT